MGALVEDAMAATSLLPSVTKGLLWTSYGESLATKEKRQLMAAATERRSSYQNGLGVFSSHTDSMTSQRDSPSLWVRISNVRLIL